MLDLLIENDGQSIIASNYWSLPAAMAGKVLVSINAGAFRLLLPASAEHSLNDMRTAKGCAVTRGPWLEQGLADAFEVLFDDGSNSPFSLHLSPESFDRLPAPEDAGREFVLSVWTQTMAGNPHRQLKRRCFYRIGLRVPDLRPWTVTK